MTRSVTRESLHVDELHIPLPLIGDPDSGNSTRISTNSALCESAAARRPSSRNNQLIRNWLSINQRLHTQPPAASRQIRIVERNQLGGIAEYRVEPGRSSVSRL